MNGEGFRGFMPRLSGRTARRDGRLPSRFALDAVRFSIGEARLDDDILSFKGAWLPEPNTERIEGGI
jgi:hypothetical protein